jgi:hypothetical protein
MKELLISYNLSYYPLVLLANWLNGSKWNLINFKKGRSHIGARGFAYISTNSLSNHTDQTPNENYAICLSFGMPSA